MGIFSKILGLFRRKKPEELEPLESLPPSMTTPSTIPSTMSPTITGEAVQTENIKAKMDLVLTQLDSMRVQYDSINQRVLTIEQMVKELLDMAKS